MYAAHSSRRFAVVWTVAWCGWVAGLAAAAVGLAVDGWSTFPLVGWIVAFPSMVVLAYLTYELAVADTPPTDRLYPMYQDWWFRMFWGSEFARAVRVARRREIPPGEQAIRAPCVGRAPIR